MKASLSFDFCLYFLCFLSFLFMPLGLQLRHEVPFFYLDFVASKGSCKPGSREPQRNERA